MIKSVSLLGVIHVVVYGLQTIQTTSSTKPCPVGFFRDGPQDPCTPCQRCDQDSLTTQSCTPTTNTQCLTCVGNLSEQLVQYPRCQQCQPCPVGYRVHTLCTDRQATKCEKCRSRTFNERLSYSMSCVLCTGCKNRRILSKCNASHNTKCGHCKKGYYEDTDRQKCYKCRLCTAGLRREKACKAATGSGRRCGNSYSRAFSRTVFLAVGNDRADGVTIGTARKTTRASTETEESKVRPHVVIETSVVSMFQGITITVVITIVLLSMGILCCYCVLNKYRHAHSHIPEQHGLMDKTYIEEGVFFYLPFYFTVLNPSVKTNDSFILSGWQNENERLCCTEGNKHELTFDTIPIHECDKKDWRNALLDGKMIDSLKCMDQFTSPSISSGDNLQQQLSIKWNDSCVSINSESDVDIEEGQIPVDVPVNSDGEGDRHYTQTLRQIPAHALGNTDNESDGNISPTLLQVPVNSDDDGKSDRNTSPTLVQIPPAPPPRMPVDRWGCDGPLPHSVGLFIQTARNRLQSPQDLPPPIPPRPAAPNPPKTCLYDPVTANLEGTFVPIV